jgi:hypothetical protein
MSQPKHQYVDVLKPYNSNDRVMHFYQQRSEAIVDKANNYFLSFDRFNIPLTSIPIFIFNNAPNHYTIELVYNGTGSGAISLTYIPPALTSATSSFYYYVFNYCMFLKMINNAIDTAFATLGGIVTLPTIPNPADPPNPFPAQPPYFQLDDVTHIVSLVGQSALYDSSLPTPIQLYMNENLFRFFNGIPLNYTSAPTVAGRNILYIFQDNYNNTATVGGVNFYSMDSEKGAQTLINWSDCKGLVITSDTLPVNPEFLPSSQQTTLNNPRSIVANFDLIYTSDAPKPVSAQYILQSPYKEIDLMGSTYINALSLNIYWYDFNNNLNDMFLYVGEAMSLRLLFTKK